MLSSLVSLLRGVRRSQRFASGHEPPLSPEVRRELEDLRKFTLSSLMTFLGIHLVTGAKALASLTLAFLIYTISLHLAISTSFLQNCPTISKVLHAIPFLGISCMAVVDLVVGAHSSALVAGCLLVGILPLVIIAVYHARSRDEMSSMHLPVRLHNVAPLRLVPDPTETAPVWSQENSHSPRRRFDTENLKREIMMIEDAC